MHGVHLLHHWASSQQIIATSSAESELYALCRCAAQTLGLISVTKDLGDHKQGSVSVDSSATLAIVHRKGLGKIRHLDVQYLWMQDCIRQNQILVEKVKGQENMADILTKYVSSDLMAKHIKSMGIVIPQGRHHLAPEVSK